MGKAQPEHDELPPASRRSGEVVRASRPSDEFPPASGRLGPDSSVRERRRLSGEMRAMRVHERANVSVELEFDVGDGERRKGFTQNISLGGLYALTTSPAPFGATVTLYLSLPGLKNAAEVKGTVRWRDDQGMGIQFGSIGAQATAAIMQLTG